jgi:putative protease
MKSIHYLAGVVKVYREALDAWYENPETYRVRKRWLKELAAISHRGYCTGFYFGDPQQTAANLDDAIRPGYRFVAKSSNNRIIFGRAMLRPWFSFDGYRLSIIGA